MKFYDLSHLVSRLFGKISGVAVILLLCVNTLSAQNNPDNISLRVDNSSIEEVLGTLNKRYNLTFVMRTPGIDTQKRISINAQGQSLESVLGTIFSGQDVTFDVKGKTVQISKREPRQTAAQSEVFRITGRVTDLQGMPLVGVTIMVKDTYNGTTSGSDGAFSVSVSKGSTLQASYIGYTPKEVRIENNAPVTIILSENTEEIESVVVTALGIKRAEKALSYNVQTVNAEELTTVKDVNFVNSLSGKVAGVTINASATGIGGATRVVMRGSKSITRDNNALYVIDGMPVLNMNRGGLEENDHMQLQPRGEGISDINPDDIESMTVLTGPSAAALYGSEAANGAIIITTKRGKAGRPQITVSNQTTFANPLIMPKFQNKYGNQTGEYASWGGELATPSNFNAKDFYNTAATVQTSVSVSLGNERNQTYLSLSNTDANGIVPNNTFDRNTVTFRNTTAFLDNKMTFDAGISLIKQKDKNMLSQGQYFNPLVSLYTFPRGEDFEQVRMYETYDQLRDINVQNWVWGDQGLNMQNPYWIANRNIQSNSRTRVMANASLKYDILPWLNVTGRVRFDRTNGKYERKLWASTNLLFAGEKGLYTLRNEEDTQIYADAIANITKTWGDFSLFANVGTSIVDNRYRASGGQGNIKQIPNLFRLTNVTTEGRNSWPIDEGWQEQTQSVFASVELGWRNMLYLTVTGRNDWSSALAYTESTSFFYPSVGLSALIHEMVKLPDQISFLKVRASFASVGTAIPRNVSFIGTMIYNKESNNFESPSVMPFSDLKPEKTNSYEIGLSAKFFGNRLSVDATYYSSRTKNQTFQVSVSPSTGYQYTQLQTGSVDNKGVELSLGYNDSWGDFALSSFVTASYNKNKVNELVDNYYDKKTGEYVNLDAYRAGGTGSVEFRITPGGTMGDIWTTKKLLNDENGYIYINPSTNNVVAVNELQKLGSVLPDWNLGWRNEFSWKDISLGFTFTARLGGIVVSPTQAILDGFGVSRESAIARENGGIAINNGKVEARKWYEAVGLGGLYSHYVYDADNVRLQELNVGYTLPSKWFNGKMKIKVSFVGRNLWMIYNKAPFDPELAASTGTYYQGIDYFMQPSLRSLGFNVQLKF